MSIFGVYNKNYKSSVIRKAADRVFRSIATIWSSVTKQLYNYNFLSDCYKCINKKTKKLEYLGCFKSFSIFCKDSSDQGPVL